MRNPLVLMGAAILLTACGAPATPAPTAAGIQVPTLGATPQPVQSLAVASVTLEPGQPPTLAPSITPQPTFLFTPSSVFQLPTQPSTPAKDLDCRLVSQSVANGSEFAPNERFTAGWRILNTGSATWYPATVQLVFAGGTKMYQDPLVQLNTTVQTGQMIALTADLRAPKNSSTYTSAWSLRRGSDYFCRLRVTIWVTP